MTATLLSVFSWHHPKQTWWLSAGYIYSVQLTGWVDLGISVCDQPPRSTQPDHPFVGRCNKYRPKGGDGLRLRSTGRYGSCVGARCMIPLLHTGHSWALERQRAYNKALYEFICLLLLFTLQFISETCEEKSIALTGKLSSL